MGEYTEAEVKNLLPPDEAHAEANALTVSGEGVRSVFLNAHKQALQQTDLPADDREWHTSQMAEIGKAKSKDLLDLTSEYFDQVKKVDPVRYQLEVDAQNQVYQLNRVVGKPERANAIIEDLHTEASRVLQTNDVLLRSKLQPGAIIGITAGATVGEAIENMTKMASNRDIPTTGWGILFGVALAQDRLGRYMDEKRAKK